MDRDFVNAIDLQHVIKRFGRFSAVDDLSLSIPRGGIFGLLGPNGAGKTTTLRMMLNIIMPDSGRIVVCGRPAGDDIKDRIGYLPEERGLYLKMRVLDVLVFLAEMKGLPAREARQRVETWLERLELSEYRRHLVEELSKGMQQKVQFISAIAHDPELLILDEPFTGLDPVNLTLVKDIMIEMQQRDVTIILSTHQMEQVERLCHRICLMDHGRSVLDGTISEVKNRFRKHHQVVLEFEGDLGFLDRPHLIQDVKFNGRTVEFRLPDHVEPGIILKDAIASGTVLRFELVEPSLHDIFIEVVRGV